MWCDMGATQTCTSASEARLADSAAEPVTVPPELRATADEVIE
jgi:hypothetical protein